MCSQRIDLAYSRLSINEKKDPQDRFIQVLDELSITGNTREYFNEKFSAILQEWFFNIDDAQEALIASKSYPLLKDKVAIFLKNSYPTRTFNRDIDLYCKGQDISVEQQKKIELLIELAKSFYPDSSYALYHSEFGKIFSLGFSKLSALIYGEEYCFSKEYFNDPSLNSLEENDRTEFLWSVFNDISNYQIIIGRSHQLPFTYNYDSLLKFIKAEKKIILQPDITDDFSKAFRFLKAWILYDAKQGRSFESLLAVIDEIINHFYELSFTDSSENGELTTAWNEGFKLELRWLLIKSFDLSNVTTLESQSWCKQIENHFLERTCNIIDDDNSSYAKQKNIVFLDLICELSTYSIQQWVKCNIEQDIKNIIEKANFSSSLLQSKWCFGDTYDAWKSEFYIQLDKLSISDRMKVLSIPPPFPRHPAYELSEKAPAFFDKHAKWWNNLYLEIPKHKMFLKSYLPNWTLLAKSKIKTAELVPYLDQSIGILRGELFCENASFDNKEAMIVLIELLTSLDRENPDKALHHRLLLFRSSTAPLCDDALNYRTKADDCLWYQPFKDLELTFINHYSSLGDEILTFYQILSQQISEFCLSRLQLRKKEKVTDGKYLSNQVVEVSPTWRQGYLKAISEIGLDLNGKAHKTAHFIKQADEDENVRAIAAETYKSVRRKNNSNPSISDLKRGIIAAEWWLLHCQRQELNLEINYDEALKTRRRLLRNP